MKRPLSHLVYTNVQSGSTSPRIITLHRYNQRASDVVAYARAAAPEGRITALESYKGVYQGRIITGYTWLIGPAECPSPVYFGDALAEIERFLWDEVDRQEGDTAELPFLLGVGQGSIMALAAAAAVPDLLSGVIAVEGFLPIVPGWEPPLVPLNGLPVLVLETGEPQPDTVLAGERLESTLTTWGANVSRQPVLAGEIPGKAMASWLANRSPRSRREPS